MQFVLLQNITLLSRQSTGVELQLFLMGFFMKKEVFIGRLVEKEEGKFLVDEKNILVEFKDAEGKDVEYWNERKDQSAFIKKVSKIQDYAIWHLLKSNLSITTKVVHATQKSMAEQLKIRPATFSESLKRFQEAELVRPFETTGNIAKGYVLNPFFVCIGKHYKMWEVWFTAGAQIRKKASAAEQEALLAADDEKYAYLVSAAHVHIADGMEMEEAANMVTLDEEEFCAVMNRLRQLARGE